MTPRFRINKNGIATVAGVPYNAMRWILDAAAVSFHEDRAKQEKENPRDRETLGLIKSMVDLLNLLQWSMNESMLQGFTVTPVTRSSRLAKVKQARNERKLIDVITDMQLNGDQGEKLLRWHQEVRDEVDLCEKRLDAHFRPLVAAALERGDIQGAKEIAKKLFGSVTGVFLFDVIRQAEQLAQGAADKAERA